MTKHANKKLPKAGANNASTEGAPASLTPAPSGYGEWLAEVKARIHVAQQRAALAVNRELLALYWQLGRDILERQTRAAWGDGILDRVLSDLRAAFPEMRGFSRSNLKYMRAFAEAWPDATVIGQQPVGQLPWGHNLVLLTRLKTQENKPLGMAEYQLVHALPAQFESSLPSIEQIESELQQAAATKRKDRRKQ